MAAKKRYSGRLRVHDRIEVCCGDKTDYGEFLEYSHGKARVLLNHWGFQRVSLDRITRKGAGETPAVQQPEAVA